MVLKGSSRSEGALPLELGKPWASAAFSYSQVIWRKLAGALPSPFP